MILDSKCSGANGFETNFLLSYQFCLATVNLDFSVIDNACLRYCRLLLHEAELDPLNR